MVTEFKLCAQCEDRKRQSKAEGKIGIVMCGACADRLAETAEAENQSRAAKMPLTFALETLALASDSERCPESEAAAKAAITTLRAALVSKLEEESRSDRVSFVVSSPVDGSELVVAQAHLPEGGCARLGRYAGAPHRSVQRR
jgi:hypothetical protein